MRLKKSRWGRGGVKGVLKRPSWHRAGHRPEIVQRAAFLHARRQRTEKSLGEFKLGGP